MPAVRRSNEPGDCSSRPFVADDAILAPRLRRVKAAAALHTANCPPRREERGRLSTCRGLPSWKEKQMAARDDRKGFAGISVGGIIVIAGILAIIFWSFWIGLIIVLIGLLAFGGFARGKWY
jgi:hypothetical protein